MPLLYEFMSQSIFPSRNERLVVPGFDPQAQPVVSHEVLRPLSEAFLQLDFICSAFDHTVEWQVEPLFSDLFQNHSHQDAVKAAVLFPLVQRPAGVHVLFTRRATHLNNHGGQISFPGGRIELTDSDAVAAALRETHEEIGVPPEFIRPLAAHPSFLTASCYTMKPIIGVMLPGFTIRPDRSEVAEVFEVPLSVLMDTRLHRLHQAPLPGGGHRVYFSITWGPYFIWGATAALIRNFYHFLAAAQAQLDR